MPATGTQAFVPVGAQADRYRSEIVRHARWWLPWSGQVATDAEVRQKG